jgi:hypothetical protein
MASTLLYGGIADIKTSVFRNVKCLQLCKNYRNNSNRCEAQETLNMMCASPLHVLSGITVGTQ